MAPRPTTVDARIVGSGPDDWARSSDVAAFEPANAAPSTMAAFHHPQLQQIPLRLQT
jgi:hypothetical protein